MLAGCGGVGRSPTPVVQTNPFLAGAVLGAAGKGLSDRDRKIAGKAQYDAISEGKRLSWKGADGSFGFILPGPVSGAGSNSCREYSHTIYLNGRPSSGKGKACKTGSGRWNIVS